MPLQVIMIEPLQMLHNLKTTTKKQHQIESCDLAEARFHLRVKN